MCVCVLFLQDSIGLLLDAVKTSNEDLAQTWKKSEQWATIEQLCSKSLLLPGLISVQFVLKCIGSVGIKQLGDTIMTILINQM